MFLYDFKHITSKYLLPFPAKLSLDVIKDSENFLGWHICIQFASIMLKVMKLQYVD